MITRGVALIYMMRLVPFECSFIILFRSLRDEHYSISQRSPRFMQKHTHL